MSRRHVQSSLVLSPSARLSTHNPTDAYTQSIIGAATYEPIGTVNVAILGEKQLKYLGARTACLEEWQLIGLPTQRRSISDLGGGGAAMVVRDIIPCQYPDELWQEASAVQEERYSQQQPYRANAVDLATLTHAHNHTTIQLRRLGQRDSA